jgi:hypothetical protein
VRFVFEREYDYRGGYSGIGKSSLVWGCAVGAGLRSLVKYIGMIGEEVGVECLGSSVNRGKFVGVEVVSKTSLC